MTRNTITGSTGSGISVAVGSYTGSMLARFNRIVDNGTYDGLTDNEPNAVIDARWNWWGCNTPNNPRPPQPRPVPGDDYGPGCGTVKGTAAATAKRTARAAAKAAAALAAPAAAAVTYDPWLILTIASDPANVQPAQAALISSTVHTDNAGGDTTGLPQPPSPYFRVIPDDFTAATGHVGPAIVTLTPQLNDSTNWPAGQRRPTKVCSTVDHQTVCLTWQALPAHPALRLVKTASVTVVKAAGTLVTYTFRVTNTGDVPLHGIAIRERAFSGAGHMTAVKGSAAALAPGASTSFTATYQVAAADLKAGQITNTALADAKTPDGVTVSSGQSSAVVKTIIVPKTVPSGRGGTAAQLTGDYMLIAGLALAPFAAAAGAMTLTRRRRSA